MIAPLVTTPLTYNYLGAEKYGLWMTVTSMTSMFVFADLGLGNGLLTKIGECYGKNDDVMARKYISSGYYMVASVAAFLFILIIVLGPIIPWEKLYKATSIDIQREVYVVTMICFAAFLCNLPFGLIQRIQLGVQQGYVSGVWHSVGSLISMALIIISVKYKASMPVLVLSAVIVNPLFSFLNGEYFYRFKRPLCRPKLSFFNYILAKDLFGLGVMFFTLSLLTSLTLYSDNLIIAKVLGLGAVAAYAIPVKISTLLSAVVTILCLPLWPANGEALARGDFNWVRKSTYRMFLLTTGCVSAGIIVFVAIGPMFFEWWLGANFKTTRMLLGSLGIWTLLLGATSPFLMVLNSKGIVRFQICMWMVFLPVSILLKYYFAGTMGLPGVPLASSIGYALIIVPGVAYAYRNILKGFGTSVSNESGNISVA